MEVSHIATTMTTTIGLLVINPYYCISCSYHSALSVAVKKDTTFLLDSIHYATTMYEVLLGTKYYGGSISKELLVYDIEAFIVSGTRGI